MSYKYILTAVSMVGDTHQKSDEFYFADGLNSVVKDVCNSASTRVVCKGKKHIFSVISCRDRFKMFCDYLYHSLMKRNNDKMRIKVQYATKSIIDELYAMTGKDIDSSMSMLSVDGSNIYASGFGNTHIYHLAPKSSKATKVMFSLPSLSETINVDTTDDESGAGSIYTWSKCLGQINVKDEYLLVGSFLQSTLGDDAVWEVLSASHCDAPLVLTNNAHAHDSSHTVTALHIMVKKSFPLFWTILSASLLGIAILLLFLL